MENAGESLDKALPRSNILSGSRVTEVVPLSNSSISEDTFAPSRVINPKPVSAENQVTDQAPATVSTPLMDNGSDPFMPLALTFPAESDRKKETENGKSAQKLIKFI
jgi:methionine-rich copper-binding protein CopC